MFQKKKKRDQCIVGEPGRGPTSEMLINFEYQDRKVIITNRDVKRCMTQKDRERFTDQVFGERIYKNEKYPAEF